LALDWKAGLALVLMLVPCVLFTGILLIRSRASLDFIYFQFRSTRVAFAITSGTRLAFHVASAFKRKSLLPPYFQIA
jgi:hypothetical protein